MATTNKGLEQPALNSTNWNTPLNSNFGYLDAALGGSVTKSVTGVGTSPVTLSLTEYQNLILNFTGVLSNNVTYRIPSGVGGQWTVRNGTTGSFTLTIDSAGGGTSVEVPSGGRRIVYSDGTNILLSDNAVTSVGAAGNVIFSDGTGFASSTNLTYSSGLLRSAIDDATSAGTSPSLRLAHTTSGTAAVGIGSGLVFSTELPAGGEAVGSSIYSVLTDATVGSEDYDIIFGLMTNGAAAAEKFRIKSTGVVIPDTALWVTDVKGKTGNNDALINGITPVSAAAVPGLSTGMTVLGTLTTTSGSTQTLSSLTLTDYKQLLFDFNGVSHNSGTSQTYSIGAGIIQTGVTSTDTASGQVWVSLWSGLAMPQITRSALPARDENNQVAQTGYSTATTSVSVSVSGGTFDAGSIRIYGVK